MLKKTLKTADELQVLIRRRIEEMGIPLDGDPPLEFFVERKPEDQWGCNWAIVRRHVPREYRHALDLVCKVLCENFQLRE